jgi:hypothetical protein
MHFEGLATRWLQFVHHRIRTTTWTELCSWIHNRFGRDQHESLIRQLLYIKQSGSIQEYIDQFSELIDQLLAYEHSASNNRYYIAHFVDGLKDDIKYVVHVQCPCDLDTAWCLALLHEEADIARRCDFKKIDYSFKPKPSALDKPLPLPPSPSIANKPPSSVFTRNVADTQATSKVAALTAYKMARGLCHYCAECDIPPLS